MRPMRFEPWLRDLITEAGDPAVRGAQTNHEAGLNRNRYGLSIGLSNGGTVILQFVARSRDGDKYGEPEQIIEADSVLPPVPAVTLPASGAIPTAAVEEWLYTLIVNAGSRELVEIERYSTLEKPGAIRYGMTLRFHDGAGMFVYVQHTLRSGQSRESQKPFEVLESV